MNHSNIILVIIVSVASNDTLFKPSLALDVPRSRCRNLRSLVAATATAKNSDTLDASNNGRANDPTNMDSVSGHEFLRDITVGPDFGWIATPAGGGAGSSKGDNERIRRKLGELLQLVILLFLMRLILKTTLVSFKNHLVMHSPIFI